MPQEPFSDRLFLSIVALGLATTLVHLFILSRMHRLGSAKWTPSPAENPIFPLCVTALLAILIAAALALTPRISFVTLSLLLGTFALTLSVTLSCFLLTFASSLNTRFKKRWVKALDFPYLFFGFVGLLRVVNSSPIITDRYETLDNAGLILIAFALAVRLSKATIEVFFDDW